MPVAIFSWSEGSFEPEHVFDPLFAMQHPEADLGPVISQKIITNQRGQVEALEDEGRVTMRVVFPASPPEAAEHVQEDAAHP